MIKYELERLGVLDTNTVQALLLFDIGDHEVTAGELKTRGYYQGSNVSCNLKKLCDKGYIHHQRREADRRSVRVRLTLWGRDVRRAVTDLFARHAQALERGVTLDAGRIDDLNRALHRVERFWCDQIRYIY